MNKKILVYVAIICIVLAIVVAFALGVSNQKTQIDNKFLTTTIHGVAIENNSGNSLSDWIINYHDSENEIYYGFIMADSLNFSKNALINVLGAEKVIAREYNGVDWEIYYLDSEFGYFDYRLFPSLSIPQFGYMCFASGKNGDYFITVTSGAVHSNSSTDSDLFENYLEPLLNNTTLKDPQNPPKEYQTLNVTKEEYDTVTNYVKQNGWEALKNSI